MAIRLYPQLVWCQKWAAGVGPVNFSHLSGSRIVLDSRG